MIELLISIVMLNVGILALVAAFNSGALAIQRASQTATAATLAEKQMELYRAQQYIERRPRGVRDVVTAPGETRPTPSDTAYNATQVTKVCAGLALAPAQCKPHAHRHRARTAISYRVDTYMVLFTPTDGRAVKSVTVVVRQARHLEDAVAPVVDVRPVHGLASF